jgi:hypothetical protein
MIQSWNRSDRDTTIADIHRTRERISDAFGGEVVQQHDEGAHQRAACRTDAETHGG